MPRFRSKSPRAVEVDEAFAAAGAEERVPSDVVLVLGGDGTLLRAVHQYGAKHAFLGVNCGNLGFLMNDVEGDPAEMAETVLSALEADAWVRQSFPRLAVRSHLAGDAVVDDLALNDVYIERRSGQTVHLRVTVDGVEAVARMACDGVVVATPLGSTAYSFSAGGPAAHPLAHATVLTAICPHMPRLAPIVLPEASRVRIEVLDADARPARSVVDGAEQGPVTEVEVRGMGDRVDLGFLAGHDFTATMIRKIIGARR